MMNKKSILASAVAMLLVSGSAAAVETVTHTFNVSYTVADIMTVTDRSNNPLSAAATAMTLEPNGVLKATFPLRFNSNAGVVRARTTTVTALTSGSNTIALAADIVREGAHAATYTLTGAAADVVAAGAMTGDVLTNHDVDLVIRSANAVQANQAKGAYAGAVGVEFTSTL
ncbi:hypothetical protein VA599_10420 [Chromobacterium sp. TRC.1.1.SA]|uniref:Adhesin n=1 Tax=Chromobacterium indicum TaxID=3110228 RepID=A0ABV0CJ30_9NEIS